VLFRSEEDPINASEARYLVGEYHRSEGNYGEAARNYADAAVLAKGREDLSARSMYMAARMARRAGDTSGARRMVRKLQTDFPDSAWAAEAGRLIHEEE